MGGAATRRQISGVIDGAAPPGAIRTSFISALLRLLLPLLLPRLVKPFVNVTFERIIAPSSMLPSARDARGRDWGGC